MMIKNYKALARTPLRKNVLAILEAAYAALDTESLMRSHVDLHDGRELHIRDLILHLDHYRRVILVGVGKSAYRASRVFAAVLGRYLAKGLVLDIQGRSFGRVRVMRGTHPLPSMANVRASTSIFKLLTRLTREDLLLFIVSGGGSTLLCQPTTRTCENETILMRVLLERGANIGEINIVRKHLSLLRGGNVATLAYPARVVSLIISDVCGNDLGVIASGPTVMDRTTVEDARRILRAYHLPPLPLIETPKDPKYFQGVTNILMGCNDIGLEAMERVAREQGFRPRIYSRALQGEASVIGKELAQACRNGEALIAGGETTVVVRGKGKGGRNQEFVLGAVAALRSGMAIASIASDGHDNTDAAGAVADDTTLKRAEQLGLDPEVHLRQNDSYHFFKPLHDLIRADPTAINVADLMVVVRQ